MRPFSLKILKITAPVVVSLLAGYLAFRNVQLKQVIAGIHQANFAMLALGLSLLVTAQILRSMRWGQLLQPLEPLGQRVLLPITCIGFLFVWILPARLGEMARPYLLSQNSNVGLSAALGSVVLERLVDAGFLAALLALCLPALQIPGWLLTSFQGFVYLLVAVALLLLLGSVPRIRQRLLRAACRFLSERPASALQRAVETFYSGMQAAVSIGRLLAVVALTLIIWGINGASFMVLFRAMDIQVGWLAAATVLVLTCLGIALPAAPGFIGNYHYACVIGITLFGVAKNSALAFAILIHFLTVVVIVLMGVLSMNLSSLKVGFSLKAHQLLGEK